ncbi:MAG: tyrosine-type recombinase/integrase [Hyphomicrobiaceae bacterium]|nr:tyrosine-type recombinase/integrase [Hyphomicrobiaceae bacterium]
MCILPIICVFCINVARTAIDPGGDRRAGGSPATALAPHLLEEGIGIRTVQEWLGHKNVRTTMSYTHVLNPGGWGVKSPADRHSDGAP